jgi:hypothetical protein
MPPNPRDSLTSPPEARSTLIDSPIESLDVTVDQAAAEAWNRELELRLKQIDVGTVQLISWSAARKRRRDRRSREYRAPPNAGALPGGF